jgi:hypothetical protein
MYSLEHFTEKSLITKTFDQVTLDRNDHLTGSSFDRTLFYHKSEQHSKNQARITQHIVLVSYLYFKYNIHI